MLKQKNKIGGNLANFFEKNKKNFCSIKELIFTFWQMEILSPKILKKGLYKAWFEVIKKKKTCTSWCVQKSIRAQH
jgi:hypothetical protein